MDFRKICLDVASFMMLKSFELLRLAGSGLGYLGQTPETYNSGLNNLVINISNGVIYPLAAVALAFALTYELYEMIMAGNNFANVDTTMFIKWMLKAWVTIIILSNIWALIGGLFQASAETYTAITQYDGFSLASGSIDKADAFVNTTRLLWEQNETIKEGEAVTLMLVMLLFFIFSLTAVFYCYFVCIGRFVTIYMTMVIAPVPIATIGSRVGAGMGGNYIRKLLSLAFQVVFISLAYIMFIYIWQSLDWTAKADFYKQIIEVSVSIVLLVSALARSSSFSDAIFNTR